MHRATVPERQEEPERLDATLFSSLPLHVLKYPVKKRDLILLRQSKKSNLGFYSCFFSFLRACEVPAVRGRKISPKALKKDKTNHPIIALGLALSLAGQVSGSANALL